MKTLSTSDRVALAFSLLQIGVVLYQLHAYFQGVVE